MFAYPTVDVSNIGSILELLAFRKIKELYPPPVYDVFTGLQYFEEDGRTAGELDIVVWKHDENKVMIIYEAKLSYNYANARRKAESQLKRFRCFLSEGRIHHFAFTSGRNHSLTPDHFARVEKYGLIGGRGVKAVGWDVEIDIARVELAS